MTMRSSATCKLATIASRISDILFTLVKKKKDFTKLKVIFIKTSSVDQRGGEEIKS